MLFTQNYYYYFNRSRLHSEEFRVALAADVDFELRRSKRRRATACQFILGVKAVFVFCFLFFVFCFFVFCFSRKEKRSKKRIGQLLFIVSSSKTMEIKFTFATVLRNNIFVVEHI